MDRFIEEKRLAGFHSARNEFDVRHYLTKPSETVPVTNKVSRLVSGIGSQNRSFNNDTAPHEIM